jgi:hypothetical protein
MWKSKKFIIISVVVAVVVLAGASIGVAFAADNPPPPNAQNAQTARTQLMERVAQILGIDQSKLESAFQQAAKEQAGQKMDQYLKDMVGSGKITQQQADQYKQWMQSKPDFQLPRGGLPRGR